MRYAGIILVAACSFQGQGDPNPGLGDDVIEADAPPPIDAPPPTLPPEHQGGETTLAFGMVTETLTEIPILVRIDTTMIDYAAVPEPHTYLAFKKDGLVLPFEDEEWNPGGISTVWVRVNQLDADQYETMTMVYGAGAVGVDTYDGKRVWSDKFDAVWHMQSDGSVPDSASNHTGPQNQTKRSPDGIVAGAREFDGSGNSVVPFSASSGLFDTWNKYTLEFWINPDNSLVTIPVVGDRRVMTKSSGLTNGRIVKVGADLEFHADWTSGGPGNGNSSTSTTSAVTPAGEWTYVAITCDGTTLLTYTNGVMSGTSACATLRDDNNVYRLGDVDPTKTWIGLIDELRVSDTTRSAVWIATVFASMKTMFVTVAVE